jgi:ribosomal protein S18 acetylase RimI-like enzyme
MEYKIRKAQLKDVPKIIELATEMVVYSKSDFRDIDIEILKSFRRTDLAGIYQLLNNPDVCLYVAENLEGEFLGHVFVMKNYVSSSTGELQGYVFDLSVCDKYQRLGIGENLMSMAEKFCAEGGMKYVCFNVTTSNEKAVKFYESIGYSEERKWMIKVITPMEVQKNDDSSKNAGSDKGNVTPAEDMSEKYNRKDADTSSV